MARELNQIGRDGPGAERPGTAIPVARLTACGRALRGLLPRISPVCAGLFTGAMLFIELSVVPWLRSLPPAAGGSRRMPGGGLSAPPCLGRACDCGACRFHGAVTRGGSRAARPRNPLGLAADRLCWLPRRRVAMSPDRQSRLTFLYSSDIRSLHRQRTLNPVAIVIRCHRVIGSPGSLTGYAGGRPRKQWLLRHESALL
jgi:hypothetical protein